MANNTYTVKKGDTLSEIALKYLGSASKYKQLASWNNISNPNRIYVGQVIKLYNPATSGGSSSSTTKAPTNVAVISHFGTNAQNPNELIVEWTWAKESETASYKVEWGYANGSGVWLGLTLSDNNVDKHNRPISRQATYSIPADATRVRFRVKPIAETQKDSKGKETSKFTASWTAFKYWDKGAAPAAPSTPEVTVDGVKLTAKVTYDNPDLDGVTHVQFRFMKNNTNTVTTSNIALTGGVASYEWSGANDSEYKFCARAYIKSRDVYSVWSNYSDNVRTKPVAPSGITEIRADSSTQVYLTWGKVNTATKYEIEYTEDKRYFDTSSQTTSETVEGDANTPNSVPPTSYYIPGLESGKEYFFRVRAWTDDIASHWTGIKSVVVGTKPAAPTTWSSTSTVIENEDVKLYWVHNSKDASRQKGAKLKLSILEDAIELGVTAIDNIYISYTPKEVDDEEAEPTYECVLKTGSYTEGATVEWQVCTRGVLPDYGPWSTPRTIDIYATPHVEVSLTTSSTVEYVRTETEISSVEGTILEDVVTTDGQAVYYVDVDGGRQYYTIIDEVYYSVQEQDVEAITSFPIYVTAEATPNNDVQSPTGYHVTITANEAYETTDNLGNFKMVNVGDEVYSEYYNPSADGNLYLELLPSSVTLENGMAYNVKCIASMTSGLTAEMTMPFTVDWEVAVCEPNAEIGVDKDLLTASIRPYCEKVETEYRLVELINGTYKLADIAAINPMYGEVVMIGSGRNQRAATLETGEPVYIGMDDAGYDVYFTVIEVHNPIEDVWLSVYRREFDGSFTEIAANLDAANRTTVTDPHPALDYARYRIVAADKATGHIEYFDCPAYSVGGKAAVLQWDEEWSNFDALEDIAPVDPALSGSMLKLPYNIDVSDSSSPEMTLVEYIGRSHPVSYYGTQLGSTSSWSMVIDKNDTETLYALRRLSRWLGDVYVREPSGSGYWAQVTVSFSQKHCEVTIPVSLSITRVEGGA